MTTPAISPLVRLEQADFSGGMYRVPRHLIPPNGVYDAVDAVLADDGSLTERGGTVFDIAAADPGHAIYGLWQGYFPVTGTQVALIVYNATGLGHVAIMRSLASTYADVIAPVDAIGIPLMEPFRIPMVGGVAFPTPDVAYAGYVPGAGFVSGTIATTFGSTTVVGTGTAFTSYAGVERGLLLSFGGNLETGVVASITDDTHLELTFPWPGPTGGGFGYSLTSYRRMTDVWPFPPLAGGEVTFAASAGSPPRLLLLKGSMMIFSEPGDPTHFLPGQGTTGANIESFHEFPDGGWGAGIESIGDTAVCFLTHGVWAVDNLNLDQTDPTGNPQHRVRRVSDLALWGNGGITQYKHAAVIAPMTDDIYIFDGRSEPINISKPITTLYRGYVEAGYRPGGAAIWHDHYILPIYDAHTEGVIDTLVCRLGSRAWTRWTTNGLTYASAYDLSDNIIRLLGGEITRLARAETCFPPTTNFVDGNGAIPRLDVTLRDQELGSNPHNQVKQVRVSYELGDNDADNPVLLGYVATDAPGSSFTQLTYPQSGAPESDGGTPFTWTANKSGRHVRVKLTKGTQPTSGLTVRRVEVFCRPAGKQV